MKAIAERKASKSMFLGEAPKPLSKWEKRWINFSYIFWNLDNWIILFMVIVAFHFLIIGAESIYHLFSPLETKCNLVLNECSQIESINRECQEFKQAECTEENYTLLLPHFPENKIKAECR